MKNMLKPRPLFALPALLASPEVEIVLCADERAADSAQKLLPDKVATTTAPNPKSPASTDFSPCQIGLADKIAEDDRGRRVAAGQHVRIVDITADAGKGMGLFEELHPQSPRPSEVRQLSQAASFDAVAGL